MSEKAPQTTSPEDIRVDVVDTTYDKQYYTNDLARLPQDREHISESSTHIISGRVGRTEVSDTGHHVVNHQETPVAPKLETGSRNIEISQTLPDGTIVAHSSKERSEQSRGRSDTWRQEAPTTTQRHLKITETRTSPDGTVTEVVPKNPERRRRAAERLAEIHGRRLIEAAQSQEAA